MPSQEDYLDSLLRNMGAELLKKEKTPEEPESAPEPSLEETLSEDILPLAEDPALEETLPEDILPSSEEPTLEETLPEDILPQKDILPSEEPASEESALEEELPEDILLQRFMPEDTELGAPDSGEETISDEMIMHGIIPEELKPEDFLSQEDILPPSEEPALEETLPENILPSSEAPALDETLPEDILPPEEPSLDEILPEDILPPSEEPALEETLPENILPSSEAPALDETLPEDILPPEEPALEEILPEDALPQEPALEEELRSEPPSAPDISENEMLNSLDWEEVDDSIFEEDQPDQTDEFDMTGFLEDAISDFDGQEDAANSKEILDFDNESVQDSEADESSYQPTSDLDALNSMSEDDIERILAAGAGEDSEDSADFPEEDVLGMLEDTDDGDLQEIHQLLDRADNDEAVSDEIEELLKEPSEEEDLEKKLLEEAAEEAMDPKARKAQEKAKKRQERAAAKKAAKEAKAAAKREKAAAKAARRGKSPVPAPEAEEAVSEEPLQERENVTEESGVTTDEDDLFDTSVLDSIVSEADAIDSGEAESVSDDGDMDLPGGDVDLTGGDADLPGGDMDLSGGDADLTGDDVDLSGSDDSDSGLGFDIGELFGDSDDSVLGGGEAASDELADFPDFVDIDSDNVENLVAKIDNSGSKKKGLLARIFNFLTEEEEEEESESLKLSDENREILSDLEKEKTAGKKKKKGKKGKAAEASGEEGREENGGDGKAKKGKKQKKPKKPKPEKPKKEKEPEPEPLIPERKLSFKRMLPVFLVCISLGALIIIFTNASVDFSEKKAAREAYYSGDYDTCFQNLYGKDLNETEQIMYGTSESVLRVRLWLSEYQLFVDSGSELEALDVLIQAVNAYPKLYEYAVQWNAGGEVQAGYQDILDVLSQKYGLTEEQALEIAGARSDIEYTKMVLFLSEGKGFGSWNDTGSTEAADLSDKDAPMPDTLPEEEGLDMRSFIDSREQ